MLTKFYGVTILIAMAFLSIGCPSNSKSGSKAFDQDLVGFWVNKDSEIEEGEIAGFRIDNSGKAYQIDINPQKEIHMATISPSYQVTMTPQGIKAGSEGGGSEVQDIQVKLQKIDKTTLTMSVLSIRVDGRPIVFEEDKVTTTTFNKVPESYVAQLKAELVEEQKIGEEIADKLVGTTWRLIEEVVKYSNGNAEGYTTTADQIEDTYEYWVGEYDKGSPQIAYNFKTIYFVNENLLDINKGQFSTPYEFSGMYLKASKTKGEILPETVGKVALKDETLVITKKTEIRFSDDSGMQDAKGVETRMSIYERVKP